MNAKINHFSIRLHVLGRTTQAHLPSFTFKVLYSRRLWPSVNCIKWRSVIKVCTCILSLTHGTQVQMAEEDIRKKLRNPAPYWYSKLRRFCHLKLGLSMILSNDMSFHMWIWYWSTFLLSDNVNRHIDWLPGEFLKFLNMVFGDRQRNMTRTTLS